MEPNFIIFTFPDFKSLVDCLKQLLFNSKITTQCDQIWTNCAALVTLPSIGQCFEPMFATI